MGTLKKYWAVLMLTCLAFGLAGTEQARAHGGTSVSFQTFYDELTPYGRWINYPGHGYVWAPDVEAGFQPYATRGHWVMTEYGNTWVSDYAWGWAPFHYGRWLWDDYYGWVWVPGNEWGPAWVSWRTGGDYYGWAPLGPGVHININIPVAHWVFVPRRHVMSRRWHNYCAPRTTVVNVYHNTIIINNYYNYNNRTYVYGPRVQEIEQHTRSRVQVHRVNQDSRPGRAVVDRGAVRMYRPEVTAQRNEAPARVVSRENFTRPDRSSVERVNDRERTDRSSISGDRSSVVREGTAENTGISPRERMAESRRSTEIGDNATGRSSTSRDDYTDRREAVIRERYPERRTNIPATDNTSPREAIRNRPDAAVRETERAPVQERVVRERPVRTPSSVERPAGLEAPVRRELPQPERSPYNPGVRQEQPAGRSVQRTVPDYSQRARQQISQPQVGQQNRQSLPQRPQRSQIQQQRQESSGGVPERRSRN
ncbi:DUF6600 domain-containing protein [Botryobacter ruber]|uniref:DUF6600 domain-containing protein n=1 Tax=Botryobacter ruber TaxID=2171629 RepID=UPI000F651F81|nr:DUF6600 domain-containing protein [Botryobacter ruber]